MKLGTFYKLFLFSILIFSVTLSGCNKNNKNSEANSSKPPQALTKIEKSIDQIISTLDKEGKISEAAQTQGNESSSGGKSEDSSNSKSSSESGSSDKKESSQDDSEKSSSNQQSSQKSPWTEVDKSVKEIHKYWSEYAPQATKDGVNTELVNNFDTDLNTLTNDIAGMNIMSTLNNCNNLYKYVPEFLSRYKDDTVNLKRIKYYVRDTMYKSRFDKWDLAISSISTAKSQLPSTRSLNKDNTKPNYESLEYSINSISKVTNERQKSLVQIKGNLAIENIRSLEKTIEEEAQNEQSK